MYLSNIKLWNFRKFGHLENFDITKPDLNLDFHNGMNVLVGENDSGKTAIIDAIRLTLHTQSYEWLRITDDDFFENTSRFRIELRFADLSDNEAKNFIEWLGYEKNQAGETYVYLKLIYDVKRDIDKNKIFASDVHAGPDETGFPLTAAAKDFLKVTYLKPLRDAASELTPGKYSRLANILISNEAFTKNDGDGRTTLKKALTDFNNTVNNFFQSDKNIKPVLDEFIKSFYEMESESKISITDPDIKSILQKLELYIKGEKNLGLGTLNRLYMAAELLNLKRENWDGAKICLIEELEAHLHPQAQMKVIEKLQQEENIQFILTSHSPNLTSKVKIENLILCTRNNCFPLGKDYTQLAKGDYVFLEKFLDVTKSNLFFARGVVFVEGWAEEIFLPYFSEFLKEKEILSKTLTEAGVPIINIGSTAFPRYENIFKRKNDEDVGVFVSVITDSDVKAYVLENDSVKKRDVKDINKDLETKRIELNEKNTNSINYFFAENWTFEYALYKSKIFTTQFQNIVKDIHSRTDFSNFEEKLAKKLLKQELNKTDIAYKFSQKLENIPCTKEELESDESIKYLGEALKFVCNK